MSEKEKDTPSKDLAESSGRLKFSQVFTSQIIAVTVGRSKTFYLHTDILITESEAFLKNLTGSFKESSENAVAMEDEDPELFGFFVEYLYRGCPIFSRKVEHYSEFATLARLYAMGERLMASKFQAYALWRFTESLHIGAAISDEIICDLLEIACTEITERTREDPMRAQVFWYAAAKIKNLQQSTMFRQLLNEIDELGKHLCLWMSKEQPGKASMPNEANDKKFTPESEYSFQIARQIKGKVEPATL
ncbi:hypothetical protein DM02DRAFT_670533 [Periconia macrospinosa]|uniref:BTB domain-containing protein n=1 Tax=Periconia macrospinosa TaxID=97972 RepID=A0A2V1DWI7_9PLEO|nr:hypothetical protein DM02DRAFT_670533 [Periconia macrospinosa]